MGLNVGANALASGGLGISTILLVVMGVLLVSASNKVREIPEYESSSALKKADNDLKTAYWLAFIGAGVNLLLGIAYAGHETAWCPSEWVHTLVFVLLFAALVISIIYAYIVLNDLYNPDLEDRNGADGFIWAALLIGALAFTGIGAIGVGRVGYNVSRTDVQKRVRHAESKVHEMHSVVTGKPNDFVPPLDCGEEPESPNGPAPAPAMMVIPANNQMNQMNQMNQGPVILPQVPQQQFRTQQFVGNPTVTRHSVVTTSQPMVTTSSPNLQTSSGSGNFL